MAYGDATYAGATYGGAGGAGGGPPPEAAGGTWLWFLKNFLAVNSRPGDPPIISGPTVTQQVVCAETASAGATTIKVNVLNAAIPSGSVLSWSGGTQATVSALAPAYASSISVSALSAGVAAGETASASINTVHIRRVSLTMPTPTLESGRPT